MLSDDWHLKDPDEPMMEGSDDEFSDLEVDEDDNDDVKDIIGAQGLGIDTPLSITISLLKTGHRSTDPTISSISQHLRVDSPTSPRHSLSQHSSPDPPTSPGHSQHSNPDSPTSPRHLSPDTPGIHSQHSNPDPPVLLESRSSHFSLLLTCSQLNLPTNST